MIFRRTAAVDGIDGLLRVDSAVERPLFSDLSVQPLLAQEQSDAKVIFLLVRVNPPIGPGNRSEYSPGISAFVCPPSQKAIVSDYNSMRNRAVWFDIPVADLDRAAAFYSSVLGIEVEKSRFNDFSFCVLEHKEGNGGCLILKPGEVASNTGILLYMNVNGCIREAVNRVTAMRGKILEATHPIGPHGFRAVVLDSEGNRIALHSTVDA
jgi:predicted enzyme related to lactoylglutathione lyase